MQELSSASHKGCRELENRLGQAGILPSWVVTATLMYQSRSLTTADRDLDLSGWEDFLTFGLSVIFRTNSSLRGFPGV